MKATTSKETTTKHVINLELDDDELVRLAVILDSVLWHESGEIGDLAEEINDHLSFDYPAFREEAKKLVNNSVYKSA